jgi:hypothetical protein
MSESTSDSGIMKEDLCAKKTNNKLFFENNSTNLNEFYQIGNKNLFLDNINNKNNEVFIKFSPLPKPDFSTIEKKDSNFKYKERGSYKKPRNIVPESPMKSPNQKFFTPIKLQSNLFGNNSTCRKLNFTEINESPKEQENTNKDSTSTSKRNSSLRNLYENSDDESNHNGNKSNLQNNNDKNNFSPFNLHKQKNLFERFEAFKTSEDKLIKEGGISLKNNEIDFLNKDTLSNESGVFNNVFYNNKDINIIINKNKNINESINDSENDETITIDNQTSCKFF